jgi:hypothetical protein
MGCDKLLPQNEPFILQTTLKIAELRNDSLGVIRADVHEWTRMSANTYGPCACHFTGDLFSIDTNLRRTVHVYFEAKNESSKGKRHLVVTGHLSKSHSFDRLNGRPVPLNPEDFDESKKRAKKNGPLHSP